MSVSELLAGKRNWHVETTDVLAGLRATPQEKPILFRPELVRKILSGSKTMTRRPVKPQSLFDGKDEIVRKHPQQDGCPFGQVGDVLWVRERWSIWNDSKDKNHEIILFAADESAWWNPEDFTEYFGTPLSDGRWMEAEFNPLEHDLPIKWRPSIHLPRKYCRLRLEIADVRVERIQSISAKDIMAEGVVDRAHESQFGRCPVSTIDGAAYMDLKSLWAAAWEKAYPGSWAKNEWVWAISFKRIT